MAEVGRERGIGVYPGDVVAGRGRGAFDGRMAGGVRVSVMMHLFDGTSDVNAGLAEKGAGPFSPKMTASGPMD